MKPKPVQLLVVRSIMEPGRVSLRAIDGGSVRKVLQSMGYEPGMVVNVTLAEEKTTVA